MKKLIFSAIACVALACSMNAANAVEKATGIVNTLPESQQNSSVEEFVGLCTGVFTFYEFGSYGVGKPLYSITVTVKTDNEADCFKWGGGATLTMADEMKLDVVGAVSYDGSK